MKKEIITLDTQVAEDVPKVMAIISEKSVQDRAASLKAGSGQANLYAVVTENLSDATRLNEAQIKNLTAYETALAVFRQASLEIRTAMDITTLEHRLAARKIHAPAAEKGGTVQAEVSEDNLTKSISDSIFFSNRYALFFAGNVGLEMIGQASKGDSKKLFSFGSANDSVADNSLLATVLNQSVKKTVAGTIDELKGERLKLDNDVLEHSLGNVFSTWVNQFSWPTYADIAKDRVIEGLEIKFNNYSVKDGTFKKRNTVVDVDSRFKKVKREQVIGNREFSNLIWQNLLKLSAHSPERNSNPYKPAKVIFTYGPPGCGKTYGAHAQIRSFEDLCIEKGIPFKAITHSITDYASHYQNLTAIQLEKLATEINNFPGAVVMYVADADTLFGGSRKKDLTPEQMNTFGVYFKMFDGTLIPQNGKFLAIMDANYVDNIDDATKSRLFDEIYELKRFDRAEDFAEMARRAVEGETGKLTIEPAQWQEIGSYILSTPLSNREIGHVLERITRNYDIPLELVGSSYEAHLDYKRQQFSSITAASITGSFKDYVAKRIEIEENSRRAKLEEDITRFLDYLQKDPATEGGVAPG